jgi:hypothetical protein
MRDLGWMIENQQIENLATTGFPFKKREHFPDTGTVKKAVIPGVLKYQSYKTGLAPSHGRLC